jgi:hypothetical protein
MDPSNGVRLNGDEDKESDEGERKKQLHLAGLEDEPRR